MDWVGLYYMMFCTKKFIYQGHGYQKGGKNGLLAFGRARFYVIQAARIKDNLSRILHAVLRRHLLVLRDKDVRHARVEQQLPRQAQRRDARPGLNVDDLAAALGHDVRHLQKMHRQRDEEARSRPVGEDAAWVAQSSADRAVVRRRRRRREQRGEDVGDAAQGGQGRGPEGLVDAAGAGDGADVVGAGGGAACFAEGAQAGFVVGEVVLGHGVAAGEEVAAVGVAEVACAVVHHHEHFLGVAAGAEDEEGVVRGRGVRWVIL